MVLFIQYILIALSFCPTSINFNACVLKFSMSIHTIISTWFPSTSRSSTTIDARAQLNQHLRIYRFLGTTLFTEYAEWVFLLSRFGLNPEIVGFYIVTLHLLSTRIKDCLYTVYAMSNMYALLYLFSAKALLPLPAILVKMTAPVSFILSNMSSAFPTRFSPTNTVKYLTSWTTNALEVLFLRKNKVFNKGRYSRNRQFYRTGVYWCLYINIIAMVGLYFWFYRFVMNFGYLWWLLYLSLSSFVVAKAFNYRLLLPTTLTKSIASDLEFFSLLVFTSCSSLIKLVITWTTGCHRTATFSFTEVPHLLQPSFAWIYVYYVKTAILQYSSVLSILKYSNVNYYIHSITLNYNRVFLASKKIDLFTAYVKMLVR